MVKITDHIVGDFVRLYGVVQVLSVDILIGCWIFNTSREFVLWYANLNVYWWCVNEASCITLVSFWDCQIALNYTELITILMNVFCPILIDKIIYISFDGRITKTLQIKEEVTWVMKLSSNKVFCICWLFHQLDLVVKQVINDVEGGNFTT